MLAVIPKKSLILLISLCLPFTETQAGFFDEAHDFFTENPVYHYILGAATAVCSTIAAIKIYKNYYRKKITRITSSQLAAYSALDAQNNIENYNAHNEAHVHCVTTVCNDDYYMLWTVAPAKATPEMIEHYSNGCKEAFDTSDYKKIITKDRAPAGFIAYNYDAERKSGIINLVGVRENYRRCHLGTALMRHALHDLQGKNCHKVQLLVRDTNVVAQNVYKKCGFMCTRAGNPMVMTLLLKD